ncbi:hypothetical protein [Pseudomonas laurentiana]|uniref:hypothetical protein n=1 Tax=Pseudomonas laurentiana TaxID=2364649 RepID=UPI0016787405|nr:hypothetical protein [Pseudomonas laurentiana]
MKIGAIPSSVAIVRTPPKPEPTEEASTSSTKESVSLSVEGLKLSASMAQVDAQNDQARDKYERIYGAHGLGKTAFLRVSMYGAEAFKQPEVSADCSPEQLSRKQMSFDFLLSIHEGRGKPANPFAGLSRPELAAIVEDESGEYTDEERYVALHAKSDLDFECFQVVASFISSGGDARPAYRSYIELLDSLSPVERFRYPAGDREIAERLLAQEEQRLGKLPAEFSIWELMAQEGRGLNKEIPAAG